MIISRRQGSNAGLLDKSKQLSQLIKLLFTLLLIIYLTVDSALAHSDHAESNTVLERLGDANFLFADIHVYSTGNKVLNSTVTVSKRAKPAKSGYDQEDNSPETKKRSGVASNTQPDSVQYRHLDTLTLVVTVDGLKYTLDLSLNKNLFARDYKEKSVSRDGETYNDLDLIASHCYYLGVVRGYNNSAAAVSTCGGITGMFRIGGETYEISTIDDSGVSQEDCVSCRHRVTRTSDNRENTGFKCGLDHDSRIFPRKTKRAALDVWPQDRDGLTRIVEIYCVNDHYQYLNFSSNEQAVLRRMKNLVNMASILYHSQNIYLVIVGAETWTSQNEIPYDPQSSSAYLNDFMAYGNKNIKLHRDVAMLITANGPFEGGTIGLANTGTCCEPEIAYYFISDVTKKPGYVFDTVAHECGHTLGLPHTPTDPSDPCFCDAPSGICIMDPFTSDFPPTEWGTCSEKNLTSKESYDKFYCLYNSPALIFEPETVCGNGLIESGEACDCGNAPTSECNPQCCSNTTCQLINSAQCAFGRCCDVPTCKLKPRYTECRAPVGECDLSEYCSGTDYLCPDNIYKSLRTPCMNGTVSAYCYEGQCNTREKYCKSMLSTSDVADGGAPEACYTANNVKGDSYGNCGPTYNIPALETWVACSNKDDALCGLLQCSTSYTSGQPDYVNITQVADGGRTINCATSLASAARQYSFVPNGAACGANKICINQQCKDLAAVTVCTNCSGHGVCNSKEQCHCDVTWGGAQCDEVGEGGSLHSNPIAHNDAIPIPTMSAPTTTTTQGPPASSISTSSTSDCGCTNPSTTVPGGAPGASTTPTAGTPADSSDRNKDLIILIAVPAGIAVCGFIVFLCLYMCLKAGDPPINVSDPSLANQINQAGNEIRQAVNGY